MKIVGVIAEYNPFHQGHAYHLKKARELTMADYVIVAMSGNYVQRGVPAMFDKYTRAGAALSNGADLVLELPLCAATGSAEYFASGAVDLLNQTGIVTDLCFGSECGSVDLLKMPAAILAEEPEEYQAVLKKILKSGLPYPKARGLALKEYAPELPDDLLNEPNNLLGLEYLKALLRSDSPIQPHTIQRAGSHYHDEEISSIKPASASGIRTALSENHGVFTDDLVLHLPSLELYTLYAGKTPITEDSFSLLLLEKLRRIQDTPLGQYFDIPEELSNRIWNCLDEFTSYSQFTDLLKTRNLTRTAVSRALLHILLDIQTYKPAKALRVLGFRKEASILLKKLLETSPLPVITNLSKAAMASEELYADHLYESVRSLLHGTPFQNEYRRKMLVL